MDENIDKNITINNNNLVSDDGSFSENETSDKEAESDTFVESKSKFEREQEESSHLSLEMLVDLSHVECYIDEQNTTASIEIENTKNISKTTQQQKKLIQNWSVNKKCFREKNPEYVSLRRFFCSHCPKSFLSVNNLQTHELLHGKNPRPFKCSFCSKKFTQKGNLYTHEKIHTRHSKQFKCTYCSKRFTQKGNKQTHERIHTRHYPFKCSLCSGKFHQLSNLNQHLLQHTDKNFNEQITSSRKDASIKKLTSHDKLRKVSSRPKDFPHNNKEKKSDYEISPVPNYFEFMNFSQHNPQLIQNVELPNSQYSKLIDCEQKISSLKNLANKNFSSIGHLELDDSGFDNLNLKEYEYERSVLQCLKSESSGETLNGSLEPTESLTKLKCTSSLDSDYSNLRQLKNSEDPTYNTNESDAGLKQNGYKSVKAKEYKRSRPFKCSYCPKDFTNKFHLMTHERIHIGYFPYGCSLCPAKFPQLSNLNKHMLHHTLGSLKCSICFKQFTSKKELKEHVDSHKNEKLFKCSVCNKKYRYHWTLGVHEKTHVGFEC